jgi:hypothetical protein
MPIFKLRPLYYQVITLQNLQANHHSIDANDWSAQTHSSSPTISSPSTSLSADDEDAQLDSLLEWFSNEAPMEQVCNLELRFVPFMIPYSKMGFVVC